MKRLYTALIAAIIAIGAAAQEETVSITLNWDLPGAINVRVGRNDVDIPADATTITLTYPKSDWPSATITAGTNRILESCTYLDDNGNTRSVALKNNPFSISMTAIKSFGVIRAGSMSCHIFIMVYLLYNLVNILYYL